MNNLHEPLTNPSLPEVTIVEAVYSPARILEHANGNKTHYKASIRIGLKIEGGCGTFMYYKDLEDE